MQKEIDLWQKEFILKPRTIYFGGGTPSLLSGNEINSIIDQFDLSQIEEISLETNPINITKKYAEEIAQTKINRISLGVQSFRKKELKLLGRLHDSTQAESAYKILRKEGFQNISFDLIYGLPYQTKADLIFSIEKFIKLEPEHISTYCLSLEADVSLYSLKNMIPADESVSEFYYLISEKLLAAGYEQYEISNFSKPGYKSMHNLCYWNDKPYLGLGPSAAGYIHNCHPEPFGTAQDKLSRRIGSDYRYSNPANVVEYYKMITKKHIHQNREELSLEDHEKEFIFLALRKTIGMNLNKFNEEFNCDFLIKYQKIIDKFYQKNLLEIEGDYIRLSSKAYFVSNEIFAEFM